MLVASTTGLLVTNQAKGAIIHTSVVGAVGVISPVGVEEVILAGTQFGIVKALENDYVIMIYKGDNAAFNLKYLGPVPAFPDPRIAG